MSTLSSPSLLPINLEFERVDCQGLPASGGGVICLCPVDEIYFTPSFPRKRESKSGCYPTSVVAQIVSRLLQARLK
jgi:hypothetical protein